MKAIAFRGAAAAAGGGLSEAKHSKVPHDPSCLLLATLAATLAATLFSVASPLPHSL
jgi:hypothetical protein